MNTWQKLLVVDRRIIFIFMAIAIIVPPLIPGLDLPIILTETVRNVFNRVDGLEAGSVVFISMDYDPTADPELTPMSLAILKHCFRKKLRVVAMTLWPGGVDLALDTIKKATIEKGEDNKETIIATEHEDWVFLGTQPGQIMLINKLCSDLKGTFRRDYAGAPTKNMPVLKGVGSLKDITLMIEIAAGSPGLDQWIIFGKEKADFEMAGGCTGVMATQYFPYIQSGQIVGLLAGLKGGAEYEKLLNEPTIATRRMASQTIAHLVIIVFIVMGNLAFFMARKKKGE